MPHCYIFDYFTASIYHVILPDKVEDIEDYICKTYNFHHSGINFMVVKEPIDVIDL